MSSRDIWKEVAVPLFLLVLFVLAFWGVFGVSKTLTKTPVIELISSDQIVTDQSEVPVTGVVRNTKTLRINGQDIPVADDGSFSTMVPVNLGENTLELAAGKEGQTRATVSVTRESVAKAITATNTETTAPVTATTDNLADSGPVETFLGSIGLAAILVSSIVYRRSVLQNTLQKA